MVHTFGIKMLDLPGDKPIKAALQALALAEEQLEQRLAAGAGSDSSRAADKGRSGGAKGGGGGSGSSKGGARQPAFSAGEGCPATATSTQQQQQQPGPEHGQQAEVGGELAAALLARIRFRRLALEALHSLQQYSQAGLEQARRCCQLAEAQLQLAADSASLAAPVQEAPGFVPDVNLRHMGLVPPRRVQARLGGVGRPLSLGAGTAAPVRGCPAAVWVQGVPSGLSQPKTWARPCECQLPRPLPPITTLALNPAGTVV